MNCLIALTFACLAAIASARPSGHGVVVSGPAGVVTGAGAWGGHGGWGGAGWGGAGWGGAGWGGAGWGGHGADAIVGPGVAVIGPAAKAAGLGGGLGVGLGVGLGLAGHGVAVVGPPTVPATIVGPAGKIVADGLYGVGPHGGYGHGHGW